MEDLKEIRYDDVGTRFKELGRTLKTEMLIPMAEKAIPYFEKFGDYAIKNTDDVIRILKILGITLGTVFVINKVATFANSVKSLATTFGLLSCDIFSAREVAQISIILNLLKLCIKNMSIKD